MTRRPLHILSCVFFALFLVQPNALAGKVCSTGKVYSADAYRLATTNADADSLRWVTAETLNSNPEIIAHLKELYAANNATRAAKGGYFPRLDVKGSYGKQRLSNYNSDFDYRHYNLIGGTATLTQNLFAGFFTNSEVSRNKYRTLAQKYMLYGAANEVALLTTRSYLDVLRTSQIIGMAKDNYNAHLRTYNMIKQRSKTGLGRKADTTQAAGRLALAKASLLAAKNNYQNSLATFRKVAGFSRYADQLRWPSQPAKAILPLNENVAREEALGKPSAS